MKNNSLLITLIIALVAGAVGFLGGRTYALRGIRTTFNRQFNGGQFNGGLNQNGQNRRGNGNGFRPITGQVTAQDDKSVTVKSPDGSSRIIILSGTTTFSKTDTAAKTDLKVGDTIGVFGTENSDGSVTAQNIQLNPQFRMGGANITPQPSK